MTILDALEAAEKAASDLAPFAGSEHLVSEVTLEGDAAQLYILLRNHAADLIAVARAAKTQYDAMKIPWNRGDRPADPYAAVWQTTRAMGDALAPVLADAD